MLLKDLSYIDKRWLFLFFFLQHNIILHKKKKDNILKIL